MAMALVGLAAKERYEHRMGTHPQLNEVTAGGRGGAAERGSFAVYGEARDVELVPTRSSCTSKVYCTKPPGHLPGGLFAIFLFEGAKIYG